MLCWSFYTIVKCWEKKLNSVAFHQLCSAAGTTSVHLKVMSWASLVAEYVGIQLYWSAEEGKGTRVLFLSICLFFRLHSEKIKIRAFLRFCITESWTVTMSNKKIYIYQCKKIYIAMYLGAYGHVMYLCAHAIYLRADSQEYTCKYGRPTTIGPESQTQWSKINLMWKKRSRGSLLKLARENLGQLHILQHSPLLPINHVVWDQDAWVYFLGPPSTVIANSLFITGCWKTTRTWIEETGGSSTEDRVLPYDDYFAQARGTNLPEFSCVLKPSFGSGKGAAKKLNDHNCLAVRNFTKFP
jgi:hypothetical protein